jgi:hypothetical protein
LADLQAITDVYNAVLSYSATDGATGPATGPTAANYATLGVVLASNVSSGDGFALFDEVVSSAGKAAIDTVPKIEALANIVSRVIGTANGVTTSPALTTSELEAIGMTGVTAENLSAVLAAISDLQTTVDGIDLANLQAAVDDGVDAYTAALEIIADFAQNNVGGPPTVTDYAFAGVNLSAPPLTPSELAAAVNSVLASAPVDGDDVDSTEKIQEVVDVYATILNATDPAGGELELNQEDYALLGLDLGDLLDEAAALLNEVLPGLETSDLSALDQLQALADIIARLLATADGETVDPPLTAEEDRKSVV